MATKQKKKILLVEDSIDQLLLVRSWLESPDHIIVHAIDGPSAKDFLTFGEWDLVVTDIEIPGSSGLELLKELKDRSPDTPVLIMTGQERIEYALEAIENRADGFMLKPLEPQDFLQKANELLAREVRKKTVSENVLVIGAHPDDVEIGCGGTILRHRQNGDPVTVLTLTGGEVGGVKSHRIKESERAAEILGVGLIVSDLTDTAVSEGPETITVIEEAIRETAATRIYTHTKNDGHKDHRAAHLATLVAARSAPNVFCYQAPSTNIDFRPTSFIDITPFVEQKIESIHAYKSQVDIRAYLADDMIRSTARYWGRFAGYSSVEPMEVIRQKQ